MSLARGVVVRLYGLLFWLLIGFVPHARELDEMLDLLDGEEDGRLL